jgi:hypothetical protein
MCMNDVPACLRSLCSALSTFTRRWFSIARTDKEEVNYRDIYIPKEKRDKSRRESIFIVDTVRLAKLCLLSLILVHSI